jgi:hypothetical protein
MDAGLASAVVAKGAWLRARTGGPLYSFTVRSCLHPPNSDSHLSLKTSRRPNAATPGVILSVNKFPESFPLREGRLLV